MRIQRTPDEISVKIVDADVIARDVDGVERSQYLEALPFDRASDYLDGEQSEESWESSDRRLRDGNAVRARALGAYEWAWEAANACRGARVARAFRVLRGSLWLLGADFSVIVEDLADPMALRFYGKAMLVRLAESLDDDWRARDNDQWMNAPEDPSITADEALSVAGE